MLDREKGGSINGEDWRPIEEQVALFKRFVEASGQGLGMATLKGRIFYGNATLCRLLGVERPDDLYKSDIFSFYEPDKLNSLRHEILPAVQDNGQWVGELNLIDPRGHVTPTIQNIFLLRDDSGQALCLANVITDISDRLRLEKELRTYRDHLEEMVAQRTAELEKSNLLLQDEIAEHQRSQKELSRLTSILENTSDLVSTALADGHLLYMNKAGRHMLGWGVDEDLRQRTLSDAHRESAVRIVREEGIPGALARGIWQGETAILNSHGAEIPVSQVIIAHRSENGDLEYLSTVMRDISERKRAEETLRESEAKFRTIFENTPMDITIIDVMNERYADINEQVRVKSGLGREEIIGHRIDEIPQIPRPEDPEEMLRLRNIFQQQGSLHNEEIRLIRPSTNECIVALLFSRIITIAGLPYVLSMVLDITERKKVEEALRESESKYRGLVENSLVGICIFQDGKARYVNKYFCDLHGYSEQETIEKLGETFLVHPDDRERVRRHMEALAQSQGVLEFNVKALAKDGRSLFTKVFARSIVYEGKSSVFVAVIDFTRERNLEIQLLQAQKMEAIGTLAGGVAHDFNNLLTAISGNTELALMNENLDPETGSYLKAVQDAAGSAAELTKQLLAFSRKQIIEPKVIDLNEEIWKTGKMLARMIGENISLRTIAQPGLNSINADPGQIQQIILNLAVNARDAMPNGGILTIETANTYVDEEFCRRYTDVSPGEYVGLSVTDTGSGMTMEVKEHLFEPFFTTKEFGKGTGLGLATVYGVVKQNRGIINVYSEPGHGTCFKIYLPKAEGEKPIFSANIEPEHLPGGSETVLLVEDDPGVREFIRRVLVQLGYHVLTARDGKEAVSVAHQYADAIELLMTDVVLPGMNGRQVADTLTRERPDLKVLFASGYTHDSIVNKGVLEHNLHFISKPFSAKDLAYKLRERLDSA